MIKVENLTKKFGQITAVNNISFEVNEGDILGFLGPNGAGKSTTMRMITGFYPPTSGKIIINKYNVIKDSHKIKFNIGYLPENSPVYKDMTPYSFLKFAAQAHGIVYPKTLKNALTRTIEMCGIEDVIYQPIDTLSKGYQQRVCLAQSIIHNPPILILDEPTDGLDPNQKDQIRDLIKKMGQTKTIIISTHILEEVDACCSRVMVISNGKIVADKTPEKFKAISETSNTILLGIKGCENYNSIKEILLHIPYLSKITLLHQKENKVKLRLYPDKIEKLTDITVELTKLIQKQNWIIEDIQIDKGCLKDVFRKITNN